MNTPFPVASSPAKAVARVNLPAGVLNRIPAGSFGPLTRFEVVFGIMLGAIFIAAVLAGFWILTDGIVGEMRF